MPNANGNVDQTFFENRTNGEGILCDTDEKNEKRPAK